MSCSAAYCRGNPCGASGTKHTAARKQTKGNAVNKLWNNIKDGASAAWQATKQFGRNVVESGKAVKAAMLAGAGALVSKVQAAAADPDTIVTDATATFEAVTVLVVAMVAFFIIVRIVKGIRR